MGIGFNPSVLDFLKTESKLIYIIPEEDDIDLVVDSFKTVLKYFGHPHEVLPYYAPRFLPDQKMVSGTEESYSRIVGKYKIFGDQKLVLVCSAKGYTFVSEDTDVIVEKSFQLEKGQSIDRETLIKLLRESGYLENDFVIEPGQYSKRGSVVDLFGLLDNNPLRIGIDFDKIETIYSFDLETQNKIQEYNVLTILPSREWFSNDSGFSKMKVFCDQNDIPKIARDSLSQDIRLGKRPPQWEFFNPWFCEKPQTLSEISLKTLHADKILIHSLHDFLEEESSTSDIVPHLNEIFHKVPNPEIITTLDLLPLPDLMMDAPAFSQNISRVLNSTETIFYQRQSSKDRLEVLFSDQKFTEGFLKEGFFYNQKYYLTEFDFFHHQPQKKVKVKKIIAADLTDIKEGDYVIHNLHGLAKYKGLEKVVVNGQAQELLSLLFKDNDKLYVPVYYAHLIQKYQSDDGQTVTLDKLGGDRFEKLKERVKGQLKNLAFNLVQLYAKRHFKKGFKFPPPSEAYKTFVADFPFTETPDQFKAIESVIKDLESEKPMDRVVCGDVGFGKTEVAMRAAALVCEAGKQVAVLCPTTILCQQHENTFKTRFRNLPYNVESLSRFKDAKSSAEIVNKLREHKIDIIIGTHKLLSDDIKFADLGLIVVDEEQRFGVVHKEKLKVLRETVDVLTLTATPIPRTLHMGLIGIRDISIISSPPQDRHSIKTFVGKYDWGTIDKAIHFEISRGGQVFFLHNQVKTIESRAFDLRERYPDYQIDIAHGQMRESSLEAVMQRFIDGKIQIMVCSSIIESGLDIPFANTLIVERADLFGLSQLYQIRGRVGRRGLQAYAYLFLPERSIPTEDAVERLRILSSYQGLGLGFQIASYDLDMRGAGNVLGAEQSGHMEAIGTDLYMELLGEAIREAKGLEAEQHFEPEIKMEIEARIPDTFIESSILRLKIYKTLSKAKDFEALDKLEDDYRNQFGHLPQEFLNLFTLMRIKILASEYRFEEVRITSGQIILVVHSSTKAKRDEIVDAVKAKRVKVTPKEELIISIEQWKPHQILEIFKKHVSKYFEAQPQNNALS